MNIYIYIFYIYIYIYLYIYIYIYIKCIFSINSDLFIMPYRIQQKVSYKGKAFEMQKHTQPLGLISHLKHIYTYNFSFKEIAFSIYFGHAYA